MSALLKCENVSLGYEGDVIAKNLNFTVSSGDYLCIVGENGSGKSTLIKALLGLKPPVSGSIELCDGMGKNEIGYLPQQTMVQRDFPASVREIVLSGCMNRCGLRPYYSKEEKKRAHDMMRRL
ncbi:MAG: ATP-binding cassette domain-containing protein, partial [Ruminococcus sp.]|nr:ATP-binding cassette domain-containing protein [Ruminococcus sp.]